MNYVNDVFSVILYCLGSILLIELIILVIKLMKTLKKADKVIDDISDKSSKLNGVFNIVDSTTDAISQFSDKLIGLAVSGLGRLFKKKNKKEIDEDEQE